VVARSEISADGAEAHAGMAAAGLLEPFDYMHLVRPRVKRQKRRRSLAKTLRLARKLGIDAVAAPDGSVTLKCSQSGVPDPAANPWDEVL
jgi:hypothetical protein